MLLKDALSLSFSIFALLISGVTAYFNLFLQTDDLSVLVEGSTRYELEAKSRKLVPHPNYMMTFVNAGNRAASVSKVYFSIGQSKGDGITAKCGTTKYWDDFRIEPFVVKVGDVVIKSVQDAQIRRFDSSDGGWSESKVTLLTCVGFSVVAPNSALRLIAVEVDRKILDVRDGLPVMPEINMEIDRAPAPLLKSWKTRVSGFDWK
jgi:hypothetical protein